MSCDSESHPGLHEPRPTREIAVIKALLVSVIVFLVATFPATWLLMLFLGNVGAPVSYWGTLPVGILVSALLGGVTTRASLP